MKLVNTIVLLFILSACSSKKNLLPQEIVWEISEAYGNCVSPKNEQCLKVREIGDPEWKDFDKEIIGFDYLEGYSYTIKLKAIPNSSPSNSSNGFNYELLKVISQNNVSQIVNGIPLLDGNFKAISLNEKDITSKNITIKINAKKRNISGFSGCNTYSVDIRQKGYQLRFAQVTATEMYCEKESRLEKEFLITYQLGDRFTLENDLLTIFDGELELLTAKRFVF